MRRVFKELLIVLLALPAILVGLFVLYEVMGMAVNHTSSAHQTKNAIKLLNTELSSVEIIDSYTETGNTSGTGNHVDMLTAIIFKTDASLPEIEGLIDRNYGLDEWYCRIEEMEKVAAFWEEAPIFYSYVSEMEVPDDLEHTYLLYINNSAPFVDNIEGH